MRVLRKYYLYEIEGSEKAIFEYKEWKELVNLTSDREKARAGEIDAVAYGQLEERSPYYIPLYMAE